MQVVLLAAPQVNWRELARVYNEQYQKNLTRALDSDNLHINSLASFYVSLSLKDKLRASLEFLDNRANHIFITFLIECDNKKVVKQLTQAGLALIIDNDIIIASGTLLQWENMLREAFTCDYHPDYNKLAAEIYDILRIDPISNTFKWNIIRGSKGVQIL